MTKVVFIGSTSAMAYEQQVSTKAFVENVAGETEPMMLTTSHYANGSTGCLIPDPLGVDEQREQRHSGYCRT